MGLGPFRWVCTSGDINDLRKSDEIACEVLERLIKSAPEEIQQQMKDNIKWIKGAQEKQLSSLAPKQGYYMQTPKEELKLPKHLITQ